MTALRGLLLALGAAACSTTPPGVAAMDALECARCHDAPDGVTTIAEGVHCVDCHQAVLSGGYNDSFSPERLIQFEADLHSLVVVPQIGDLGRRLKRSWVEDFLQHPHTIRPSLGASMPRSPITADQARAIAAHLVPPSAEWPAPPTGDARRGLQRMRDAGCGGCHHFTGVPSWPTASGDARTSPLIALAPDLRFTRDRMSAGAIAAWLDDPTQVQPSARMPDMGLPAADIIDITQALVSLPLDPEPACRPHALPPAVPRDVRYAEVVDRVFGRVCRHCHGQDRLWVRDAGPGNSGGLGWPGARLNLLTYEGVRRGAQIRGVDVDVLAPDDSGVPPLLQHLLARHEEACGRTVEGVLGMPLGLPPVPDEDLALIRAWIEQGARRN